MAWTNPYGIAKCLSVCMSEHVSSLRRFLDKKKKRRGWTSRRNVTLGWISSGNCLLLLFLLQYKGTGHQKMRRTCTCI